MRTPTLNRRQFVVMGTATVAGMAARLPVHANTPLPGGFVSIGYTSGRTRLRIGGRGPASPTSFIDARSLTSGDPAFFREGARIRIHGFERVEAPAHSERLDVEILFPLEGEEQPTPFYAFSSIVSPGRNMTANPVGFIAAAESTGSIEMAIQRQRLDEPGSTERLVVSFSVNDLGDGALKLNEGLYAVALLRPHQASPDWASIRTDIAVSRFEKAPVKLVHDVFGETVPVGFDYLMLSVVSADSPEKPAVRGEQAIILGNDER